MIKKRESLSAILGITAKLHGRLFCIYESTHEEYCKYCNILFIYYIIYVQNKYYYMLILIIFNIFTYPEEVN